jgi:hypothetical protein
MKFLLVLTIFFAVLLIASCGPTNHMSPDEKASLDEWIGKTRTDLIKFWGRPEKETPDGKGGEIITFDTSIVHPRPSTSLYNNGNRGLDNTASNNYVVTKSRVFYLNSQAIIYHWDAEERQGY